MITIGKRFTFEAAHFIKDHPTCGKLHGHSWVLDVMLKGEIPESGMLLDFKVLGGIVRDVTKYLDHQSINTVAKDLAYLGMPEVLTAETLVKWFTQAISARMENVFGNMPQIVVGCRLQEGIDGGWAEYWEAA